jgi:hypothetical protein
MIDRGRALHRVRGAAVAALLPRRRHQRRGRPVAACRAGGDSPPVADDRVPPGGAAADPWGREAGTYVDAATITRLRDEARRTRDEVEQLLSDVGYGARSSCPPDVDARRDLDHTTDVDIETLMRIDDLHADRRSPTSERSRQRAERVLNEIMHRVIDGYQIEDKPQSRVVKAGRGMEARVTRAYLRVSLLGRRTAWAERWRAGARVALIGLALAAAGTLAAGHLAAAALIVAARAVVSAASTPPPPTATSLRWMSYNPDWLGGAVLNVGDAVILIGDLLRAPAPSAGPAGRQGGRHPRGGRSGVQDRRRPRVPHPAVGPAASGARRCGCGSSRRPPRWTAGRRPTGPRCSPRHGVKRDP